MNYKELFHIAMQLISSPAHAWEEISLEDRRKVFTAFVYPMFAMDNDIPLVQQFAGYALVVSFMLKIIIGILPDFSIIALLLQFYIVYVVWEGSAILMKIAEKDRLRFTILSSMLLIACPAVIEFVFNKLTVVLN